MVGLEIGVIAKNPLLNSFLFEKENK